MYSLATLQKKELEFIGQLLAVTKGSPLGFASMHEIGEHLKLSQSDTLMIKRRLQESGIIRVRGLGGEIGFTEQACQILSPR